MIQPRILNEEWKPVEFNFEFTNKTRFEISNLGNFRSFNKVSDGRILNGSLTEGFKVIKLRFYTPRNEKDELYFAGLRKELSELYSLKRLKKKYSMPPSSIEVSTRLIDKKKAQLSRKLDLNLKKRTINHHFMVHRLVAAYFLPQPKPGQTIVAHLNYNKLDNRYTNLQWMSQEEYSLHQSRNPKVIEEKMRRIHNPKPRAKGMKLTSTQVIHIKLLLRKNKPSKQIAKQFGISEMQVWRIKSGENWSSVKIPD